MTCTHSGNNIVYHNFEFRFLLWRCKFIDKVYFGPFWYLSIPKFQIFQYINDVRIFGFKKCKITKYFNYYEKEYYPGDRNILWKIFYYHYNKYKQERVK